MNSATPNKGEKFSLRTVEEVKRDIDIVQEIVSEVKALSWQHGFGGEITAPLVNLILQNPKHYSDGFRSVTLWLYTGGKNVFLQDGNNLILKTHDLLEMLKYLKETFPSMLRKKINKKINYLTFKILMVYDGHHFVRCLNFYYGKDF